VSDNSRALCDSERRVCQVVVKQFKGAMKGNVDVWSKQNGLIATVAIECIKPVILEMSVTATFKAFVSIITLQKDLEY